MVKLVDVMPPFYLKMVKILRGCFFLLYNKKALKRCVFKGFFIVLTRVFRILGS